MIQQGFLKLRILLIFFLGIFFFLFIIGRSLQLQLIPNKKLAELARRQYRTAVTLFPKRGSIYDRDLNELAVSRKVGSLFAYPPKIKNPRAAAAKLSRLTGIPERALYKKLSSKKSFVWIRRLMEDSVTERVKKQPMAGIELLYEYKRFYPNQEILGQVLGTVGVDSQGIEGVEYHFDKLLYGKKKSVVFMRDARGRPITFDKTLFMEAEGGGSLVLTIHKSLQFLIERELEAAVRRLQAKSALALIQDVTTGEILTMAQYPFFNPNQLASYAQGHWKNRSVVDVFEPGSTFKIFLAALALERGIKPSEQFFCENGFYRVAKDATIREAQNHKFKWLSFQDVIKYSSNIGAAKIARRLGGASFHRKILDFGFGSETGIEAPGESTGIVRPVREWTSVDLSNIAFGQGISVTAIQLLSAVSAIANDGKLMRPILLRRIMDPQGRDVEITQPQVIRQALAPEIARRLTRFLVRVTEPDGTGHLAVFNERQKVAGKTGTAQKPNLQSGGYWEDKYISSFVGFFPAQKPKYSIFVMIDEPQTSYYASQIAAPLFKAAALHTAHIFPQEMDMLIAQPPKKSFQAVRRAKKISPPQKINYRIIEGNTKMADLRGKSLREVLAYASETGLVLKIQGSGIAVHQSLQHGALIQPRQKCMVTFRAPSQ